MKASKKSGGIKQLLLAHCEKAIALLIIVGGAYLVYASLGIEGETRDADDLQQSVTQTRNAFQNANWEDVPDENKRVAYDPGGDVMASIPSDVYTVSTNSWGGPVVPPTVERTDPELLPAMAVEGSGVTGLMGFLDDSIRGQRERDLERARQEEDENARREEERQNQEPFNARGGGRGRGGEGGFAGGGRNPEEGRPAPRVVDNGFVPQGDELIKKVSCAIVLAKAPSLDQYNIYKTELSEARGYDPMLDVPNYLGYMVERAEVTDGQELEWSRVNVTDGNGRYSKSAVSSQTIEGAIKDWAGSGLPIVDARYEHEVLTMPLPSFVGQDLGLLAVHSEAPLQSETDAKLLEEENTEQPEAAPDDAGDDGDLFANNDPVGPGFGGRDDRRGGRGFDGGARGGFDGRRGGRGGFDEGGGFDGGREGGMAMDRGRGRAPRARGGVTRRGGGATFDPEVPFQMVRFYDFTVQPGRQYRYRIKMVVEDVNQAYHVEPRHLAREVVVRIEESKGAGGKPKKYRLTEWSEPSSIISVPMAGDVFIAGANPPGRGAGAEGTLDLLVQSFKLDEDQRAVKGGVIQTFRRGSVMNLVEDIEVLSADRRWIVESEDFEFRTGITLCDFTGGEELARDMQAPARALLMDASGRLFVREQLDDAQAVEQHRQVFEAEADEQNRFGPPGGRGRGGFDEGGFGSWRPSEEGWLSARGASVAVAGGARGRFLVSL